MELIERKSPQFQPVELIASIIPDTHPKKATTIQRLQTQNVHFEGGDGSSPEEAIIMCGIQTSSLGLPLEMAYLQKLGKLPYKSQKCQPSERVIEGFEAQDGTWTWFDITEWFGK